METDKRRDFLMIELDKMNKWIEQSIQSRVISKDDSQPYSLKTSIHPLKKSSDKPKGQYRFNYHGLLLPLSEGGGDDQDPFIMTKIVPHLN